MILEHALKQSPQTVPPRKLRALVRLHWPGRLYEFAAKVGINPSALSTGLSGKRRLSPDMVRRILVALSLEEEGRHD